MTGAASIPSQREAQFIRHRSKFVGGLALIIAAAPLYSAESHEVVHSFEELAGNLIPELLRENHVPGAVVAVNRQGRLTWLRAFGLANAATGVPMKDNAIFSVGSVSKSVAAWGVLRLVQDGKLSLDEPVQPKLRRWAFPPGKFSGDKITARQLLNHTSGLSLSGYPGWSDPNQLPSLERSLAGDTNTSEEIHIVSEPGQRMSYSGAGYTVLQLLLEEVSGESFETFMRSSVLLPLKMMDSSYRVPVPVSIKQATAHDSLGRPISTRLFAEKAAAGLTTTAADLSRMLSALAPGPGVVPGGSVIGPDKVEEMIGSAATVEIPGDLEERMGLGYYVAEQVNGKKVIGHGGWNIGWYARFRAQPETGDSIVVLTNGNNGTAVAGPVICAWQQGLSTTPIVNSPCKRSALSQLLIAFESGGSGQAITRLKSLQHDSRFDLSSSTAASFAHMTIHEAPLDAVTVARLDGVIQVLRFNLQLFPADSRAWRAVAAAYIRAGQSAPALEFVKKAYELDPMDSDTRLMAADLGVLSLGAHR